MLERDRGNRRCRRQLVTRKSTEIKMILDINHIHFYCTLIVNVLLANYTLAYTIWLHSNSISSQNIVFRKDFEGATVNHCQVSIACDSKLRNDFYEEHADGNSKAP
uniref:Uncharacterized protein n=1 Tax=Pyxicephalus adspersus TaxID=30357 RepID=A0AAV3A1T6_PYXAD|nr:TPA: hypothetical protein GDO54_017409 [Pyxicephalus adspersus]